MALSALDEVRRLIDRARNGGFKTAVPPVSRKPLVGGLVGTAANRVRQQFTNRPVVGGVAGHTIQGIRDLPRSVVATPEFIRRSPIAARTQQAVERIPGVAPFSTGFTNSFSMGLTQAPITANRTPFMQQPLGNQAAHVAGYGAGILANPLGIVGKGVSAIPAVARAGAPLARAVSPLTAKLATSVAGRLALKAAPKIAGQAAFEAGYAPFAVGANKAGLREEYTPMEALTGIAIGSVIPGSFGRGKKGAIKAKFSMDKTTIDELVQAEDMLLNPKNWVGKIPDLKRGSTIKDTAKLIQQRGVETVERLAARYLPDRQINTLKTPQAKIRALIDLSQQNRLANVPGMGIVGKADDTKGSLYDIEGRTNKIFDELNKIDEKLDKLGVDYTKISKSRRTQIDIQRDVLAKQRNRLLDQLDEINGKTTNVPSTEGNRLSRPTSPNEINLSSSKSRPSLSKTLGRASDTNKQLQELDRLTERLNKAGMGSSQANYNTESTGIGRGSNLPIRGESKFAPTANVAQPPLSDVKAPMMGFASSNEGEIMRAKADKLPSSPTLDNQALRLKKMIEDQKARKAGMQEPPHPAEAVDPIVENSYRENQNTSGFRPNTAQAGQGGANPPPPPKPGTAYTESIPPDFEAEVKKIEKAVEKPTPVNKKVNLLDYFRTPDRVLTKIGLEQEGKLLRKKYDDYLRELPVEINKITEWSKRVSPQSNERIFKHLDGQNIALNRQEQQVANEIKGYLKEWANKLGLPEDKQISHYITHIFEPDFIKKEFDEDIAALIRDRVPGSVYDPFLLQRLGKLGYIEDTWRALDAYVKRAVRKYNMDPALSKIQAKSKGLEDSQLDYVLSLTSRVNLRPTKLDNLIDNLAKSIPGVGYKFGGRPVNTLSRNLRQWIYRGTLGLNFGSAVKNLTQGANTYAKLGEKYTGIGYLQALKNWRSGELDRVGVLRDNFIQDRKLSATKKALEKMDKGLFFFFETAEKINRGAAYFGAKAKALDKEMSEEQAIEFARNVVRDTQFTFGSVDTPVALQSDIAKTLSQFQSFTLKQGEFLTEMIKNKDVAGITRWVGASLLMVYAFGEAIGMEPKDLIPSLRIGTPPALKTPVEIGKAVLNTPDKYGNERTPQEKLTDIGKSLIPFVPAGTQIKKTYEGLSAINKGASTTPTGRVRYPIEKNVGNTIKAGLFGQYSFKNAQSYFNNNDSPLGEKDSERYFATPDNQKKSVFEEITREREAKKMEKKQKEIKKEAVKYFLEGNKDKAKALIQKNNLTLTKGDIKDYQKKIVKDAAEVYVQGNPDEAKKMITEAGVQLTKGDVAKAAKRRAVELYKLGMIEEAKAVAQQYNITITRKDVE